MGNRSNGSALSRVVTFACLAGFGSLLFTANAVAAVGRTAGSFNVGSNGSASYTIPIFTPPGPRGVQPSVALVYNSRAGIGTIGRGWSVSGFSSISRCDKTIAQDGANSPVKGISSDGYCVDGNRLRLQSGTYGGHGSVYFTELADFSRITATTTGSNGPDSWSVQRKDGLTYTYGGTSNSRIQTSSQVLTWYVSDISDRAGNKVRFTYKSPDSTTYGITHPIKIEWTQDSAGSDVYLYSMNFNYSAGGNTAASTISGFDATWPVLDSDLLTSITVKVSGTVKRNYMLGYETSPTTGALRLNQVTECSDPGPYPSDCLAPTTITYQNGTAGVNVASPILSLSGAIYAANGEYDFNGDGIKDMAVLDWTSGPVHSIRMGSASGTYGSPITTGAYPSYGRLLGNSRDQALGHSGGYWYVYDWNGSGFTATNTGITTSAMPYVNVIADIDGDGREDIVWADGAYEVATSGEGVYPHGYTHVYRNTSTGGSASFASPVTSTLELPDRIDNTFHAMWGSPPTGYRYMSFVTYGNLVKGGDEDGDGRQELNLTTGSEYGWLPDGYPLEYRITADYYQETNVLRFNSDLTVIPITHGWWSQPDQSVGAGDFNGDGCKDYLIYDSSYGNATGLADCAGGIGATLPSIWYGANVGAADWNGDGKSEVFQFDGTTLWARAVTGGALGTAVDTGIPWSSNCTFVRTDGNGDGLDDIGCYDIGAGLTVYAHNNAAVNPDLVTQIQDGFGVTNTVTYKSIARGSYTSYTTASFPNRDVTGGMLVVSAAESSNGIGGTYTTTYSYHGGVENRLGRGFQGFAKIEATDSRNSVKHVQKFSQTFPYVGMLVEDATYQSDDTLISKTVLTPGKHDLDATTHNERYFPYAASSVTDSHEVGSVRNGDWLTRSTVSNTFDIWGNLTASTNVVTEKDSGSAGYGYTLYGAEWTTTASQSISPNTTHWCLNLPSSVTVTQSSTVTGETTPIVQVKGYTPDYAHCRQDAESVGSGALQVDTNYSYADSFGNITGVSVTGRNPNSSSMTARTASIGWGTTGQFPVSETNALSQTTTRTFHSTFGSLLTETDPNGIVVTQEYDAFGRPTHSIRPDGTATRITYAACATYGCENGDPASGATGINKTVVVTSERDTGDSQIRETRTYLDQFGRSIVQKAMTAAGGYSRVGTQYDAFGRTYRQTAPCDASSCSTFWVTNTYDLVGRTIYQSRPQSQSVSTPVTTSIYYGGRVQMVTDPQNKGTTKLTDPFGRLRMSVSANGYYQRFAYDAAGTLKQVTDLLSNTLFTATYSYGIRPFQTATTDMDMGSWSYTYNSLGELVEWTDAKSQAFSQTYDALSRLTSRTEAEGTTTWTWGTSAGSHNIGGLASVSMTGYSESLSFDGIGRLSTRSITTDQTYDIDYAYNNQGAVDTVTYPTSTSSTRVKVKYGYDYGILKSVTDWTTGSAGTVYWTANAHNPRGQTTQETLGNGVVTNRSFDAVTGWMSSIQSAVGGGTALQNQSYLYDLIGNVTQRQENTQGLTENFHYDEVYRLDYSQLNSTTNLDLSYDFMGNITSRSDVNGGATWTYHGTKKHAVATTGTGGTSYSYDDNGNMTSRAGQTISWSSYNYATGLATATESTAFYYGPDRQYYKQIYTGPSGTETTHYVGGLLEKVYDGTTTDWRHNIVAGGSVVAIVSRKSSSTNAVYYPLEDSQGSGSVLTDSSGTNLVRQSYNAFGLPRDGADWDGAVPSGDKATINGISRRGYTGHSMLGDMGLIHMNGRVQDAVTGRFLSPDPNIPDAGFTQSYNRYAYVNNNPMSYTDPSGFIPRFDGNDTAYIGGSMWRGEDIQNLLQFCGDAAFGGSDQEICSYWAGVLSEMYDVWDREQSNNSAIDALQYKTLEDLRQHQVLDVAKQIKEQLAAYCAAMGIPGVEAGDEAAQHWANIVINSSGWKKFGAQVGLAFSVLWTPDTATDTAVELASAPFVILKAGKLISLTERGIAHVLERHVVGGARTAGKSLFTAGEDALALIRNANSVQRVQQQTGRNFERVVDAGRIIGVDRVTGQPTSIYTVITNAADELVTAFPGRPGI